MGRSRRIQRVECIDICADILLDAPIVENMEEVGERLFVHQ